MYNACCRAVFLWYVSYAKYTVKPVLKTTCIQRPPLYTTWLGPKSNFAIVLHTDTACIKRPLKTSFTILSLYCRHRKCYFLCQVNVNRLMASLSIYLAGVFDGSMYAMFVQHALATDECSTRLAEVLQLPLRVDLAGEARDTPQQTLVVVMLRALPHDLAPLVGCQDLHQSLQLEVHGQFYKVCIRIITSQSLGPHP